MSEAFSVILFLVLAVGIVSLLVTDHETLLDRFAAAVNRLIGRALGRGDVSTIGPTRPSTGVAKADFRVDKEGRRATGKILAGGEIWNAASDCLDEPIRKGQDVKILDIDGLTVKVEPVREPSSS